MINVGVDLLCIGILLRNPNRRVELFDILKRNGLVMTLGQRS